MNLARTGLLVLLILAAAVAALGARAYDLAQVAVRHRSAASAARATADSLAAHIAATRERTLIARLRAQARATPGLLLAIVLDSSHATLFRDGLPLRQMPVERYAGTATDSASVVARGEYTVGRVFGPKDSIEVPGIAWTARGEAAPAARTARGGLGPVAVELVDGPWLYTRPAEGPLADSTFVLPGALRFAPRDLQAIKPNLAAGTTVLVY